MFQFKTKFWKQVQSFSFVIKFSNVKKGNKYSNEHQFCFRQGHVKTLYNNTIRISCDILLPPFRDGEILH